MCISRFNVKLKLTVHLKLTLNGGNKGGNSYKAQLQQLWLFDNLFWNFLVRKYIDQDTLLIHQT